jgi:multiple sugar transport system ATP-binding protein
MASVTLTDVEKRWGDWVGVARQNLTIADGEFLVLLGPSGCGKTTTMRMIAGLEMPSGGSIRIGDRVVNDVVPKDRDVAMVFQNYGLYPHMTVAQNIGYPLKVRRVPKAERERRVAEAAAKVELDTLLQRRPRELSGGQRQRVALARAIVRTPQVFLMDEPLSNLDAKLRVTMRAEIKHLQHDMGVTTIYVTHDQIEAMTLAHRVAVMNKGVIQQIAPPAEIYDRPANLFVAGFIGSPAMNLIPGHLEHGTFSAPGMRVDGIPGRADTGAVVLGVRPEDLAVSDDAAAMEGTVYAVELTGEAQLITANIGPVRVIAKVDRSVKMDFGQTIRLQIVDRRLQIFDAASGLRRE